MTQFKTKKLKRTKHESFLTFSILSLVAVGLASLGFMTFADETNGGGENGDIIIPINQDFSDSVSFPWLTKFVIGSDGIAGVTISGSNVYATNFCEWGDQDPKCINLKYIDDQLVIMKNGQNGFESSLNEINGDLSTIQEDIQKINGNQTTFNSQIEALSGAVDTLNANMNNNYPTISSLGLTNITLNELINNLAEAKANEIITNIMGADLINELENGCDGNGISLSDYIKASGDPSCNIIN